jgi:asparaginyl-tRNA synthetase
VERALIKDILEKGNFGQQVTVCGWVRTRRESKGFAFVVLHDGSTQDTLQLVIPGKTPASQEVHRCDTGAAIRAKGVLKESPGKGQRVEVEVTVIDVFGESDPYQYPLQKKGHTLDFLREITHLRPRTNTFGAVFRIRNILAAAVHEFFQDRGVFAGSIPRSSPPAIVKGQGSSFQ